MRSEKEMLDLIINLSLIHIFIPLEVFPLLWDEANPCLFLAKQLACSQENRG